MYFGTAERDSQTTEFMY